MKYAHTWAVLILAGFANVALARADAPHDDPIGFDATLAPSADVTSPDYVPDFLKDTKSGPTPEERDALQAAQQKAEENKDWLLRGFEQQLQSRENATGDNPPQNGTNLLATLGADKDLAKAAGIRPIDLTAAPELNPLTGEDEKKTKADLRSDPMLDPLASTDSRTAPLFQPLIIPLDSPTTSQVKTPYALPSPISSTSVSSPLSFDLAPGETAEDDAAQNVAPSDPGAMDVPGMTAAESTPAMREALDLPGEQENDALSSEEKPHHDLALELPEAPETSNADRLQKIQNASLALPTQPLLHKAAPIVINPLSTKPPAYTPPVAPVESPSPHSSRGSLRYSSLATWGRTLVLVHQRTPDGNGIGGKNLLEGFGAVRLGQRYHFSLVAF